MTLLRKSGGYTLTARLLHWLIAVLVLFQIPAGLLIANFEMGPLYGLHKSAGVLILILVIVRLAWRLTHPVPALPPDIPRLQRLAARGTHRALYALLIAQSLIGWIGTSAYPAPVPFFGLFEMPQIWWEDRQLSNRLLAAHLWIGILMAVLLVGHVGAALHHHFVRGDEILLRMLRG
ncbi:MAG TPA: cytochrome b [Pseudolabrys sp.]|nr:cytochrome b [Pseudolabrys sp.]